MALFDLPNEALSYAASFVALPSRVLFAIAINSARDDELLSQADVLDFGAVETSLAAKITDGILLAVLESINATAKLKKLKLAGCINITGWGLDPLRGSSVLEQIDLSLVAEHKSPVLDSEPRLSREHLLLILGSIIGRDENVLRLIVFPKSWRREGNAELIEFMERYNQLCQRRHITCLECDRGVEHDTTSGWFIIDDEEFYGLQQFTCSGCMKHFCYDCTDENDDQFLRYCTICEKEYCKECSSMEYCNKCYRYQCKKCKSLVKCGGADPGGHLCSRKFCGGCASAERQVSCDKCDKPLCSACWDFRRCYSCNRAYCADCKNREDDGNYCERCGTGNLEIESES